MVVVIAMCINKLYMYNLVAFVDTQKQIYKSAHVSGSTSAGSASNRQHTFTDLNIRNYALN